MAPDKIVIAFDLYGTLLSTESIAEKIAKHFGNDKANAVASSWRTFQLEYSWRLNSMKRFESFKDVTRKSLLHALAENSVSLSDDDVDGLMRAYDSLNVFPDVKPALESLAGMKDRVTAVVFSNGTNSMVTSSVRHSEDLKPYSDVFADLVTVEDSKHFKPAPEVYYHLAKRVGKGTDPESMSTLWLVSGNPFDVVGARAVGMRAIWVDRVGHHSSGQGWTDKLMSPEFGPTSIVKGLGEVVATVEKHASSKDST